MSSQVQDERQPLLHRESEPDIVAEDAQDTLVDVPSESDTPVPVNGKPARSEEDSSSGFWILVLWLVLMVIALVLIVLFIVGFLKTANKDFDFEKALKSALGGGLTGAAAMVLQVLTLMPIRTIMNYQYRFGTSLRSATLTLYTAGGLPRYYQGLLAALIQGPTSRFGDTAANAGIRALLESNEYVREKMPDLVKSAFASAAAALFRMVLTPIDTVKTTLQSQGKEGMGILRERVKVHGVGSLFWGAWATAAATFVGHYPWFGTFNYLDTHIPHPSALIVTLLRNAFIGFCASVISDTCSNSIRVVKTYRQVNDVEIGYLEAARTIVRGPEGWKGLFGRGLKTRILANGLQGMMFSVLWKLFLDIWNEKTKT